MAGVVVPTLALRLAGSAMGVFVLLALLELLLMVLA